MEFYTPEAMSLVVSEVFFVFFPITSLWDLLIQKGLMLESTIHCYILNIMVSEMKTFMFFP